MAFQPTPHDTITIGGVAWRVAEHPAAPEQPFARAGGQATVYRLQTGGDGAEVESRALKVFEPAGRTPALAMQADWLATHADLAGLAVNRRQVLTPNREREVLAAHPDLQFAIVMPWIEGPTWADVVAQRYPLPPDWSLALARSLAMILAGLEQAGLAHCQVSGANVVVPGLVGQTGGDVAGHPVALVDVEGFYAPDLAASVAASPTSPAYRHPITGVVRDATADRFPGALLLTEMLGWCDEQVRAAAHGDSVLDPTMLQRPSGAYTMLAERVAAWWGPEVAGLVERTWASQQPADCPTFAEWLAALPSAAPQAALFAAPPVAATGAPAAADTAIVAGLAAAAAVPATPTAPVAASSAETAPVAEEPAPVAAAGTGASRPRPVAATGRGPSPLAIVGSVVAGIVLLVALAGGIWILRPFGVPLPGAASGPKPTTVAAVVPTVAPQPPTVAPPTVAATVQAAPTAPPATTRVATAMPAATVVAAGVAAAPAGTSLAILYSSHSPEEHDSQIWVMDPDGGRKQPLTFTRGHSWAPRLSPDGQRFLFSSVAPGAHTSHDPTGGGTSTSPGNHDIYVGDADGTNITNITAGFNSWDNGWSWSPDGKWIAFSSDRDGNWELYKMTATGESITRLTNDPKSDGWPAWTPDGKNIVFASDRTGNWELFIMGENGANVKQLTERPTTYDTFPAVSLDGKKIAFSSQLPGRNEGEIYTINIDGSGLTRLTSTVAMNNVPSWCPDGRIVFVSDRAGNDDIWIMNGDGSNVIRLTANRGEDTTPSCGFMRRAGA